MELTNIKVAGIYVSHSKYEEIGISGLEVLCMVAWTRYTCNIIKLLLYQLSLHIKFHYFQKSTYSLEIFNCTKHVRCINPCIMISSFHQVVRYQPNNFSLPSVYSKLHHKRHKVGQEGRIHNAEHQPHQTHQQHPTQTPHHMVSVPAGKWKFNEH